MPRGLKTGMEISAPLFDGIVNNASFYSDSHINQTLHQIIHILHFLTGGLVAKLCPSLCSQLD